jgi:protein-disulfide isomerase
MLGAGLAVVAAFAGGVVVYNQQQANALSVLAQAKDSVFNRPYSPVYGEAGAKVRIVEFFDPACETCRAFYPLVKKIVDDSAGRVQLVVRYLPLHQGSDQVARLLEAARLQGLFWPVAEAILRGQPVWADHARPQPELVWDMLGTTGLNVRKARDDTATPAVQASIDQDVADAKALGVELTPGFFVNGQPLTSFGLQQLQDLVTQETRKAYAL